MTDLNKSVLWQDVKKRLGVKRMPKEVGKNLKLVEDEVRGFDKELVLLQAFFWDRSPQGHGYWESIYKGNMPK